MNVLPAPSRNLIQSSRSAFGLVAAVGLVALSLAFPMSSAGAAAGGGALTICHSTGATNNPYVVNHPNRTADAGGHDGHKGPIWTPSLPAGVAWGDIIPPFNIIGGGVYPGMNWTLDGQEIWNNNCNAVNPDLRIVKTSSGNALVGSTGTYTITVSNIGNGTAHGPFTVSDTMPAGVTATAAAGGAAWVCTVAVGGGSISCAHAADLAPGATAAVITVNVDWVTVGTKANTATVTVLPADPPANNTSTVTDTISVAPVNPIDVALLKTNDGNGNGTFTDTEVVPVVAAGNVTYRLRVENPTAFPLDVVSLTDVVDANPAAAITCDPANPVLVAAGQTSLGATLPANSVRWCYWTAAPPANGASHGDLATINVRETAHPTNTDSASDDTSVSRLPIPILSGDVVKTTDADGNGTATDDETTTAAAGSSVAYTALITNSSPVQVDLAISDTWGPGPAGVGTTFVPTCVPAAPATLDAAGGPNDSFTCNFTVPASSPAAGASTVDTFTATLSAAGSAPVTPNGKATVRKALGPVTAGPKPTIVASSCVAGAAVPSSYVVPTTAHVTYSVTGVGAVISGSTRSGTAPTTETLTAAADPGFVLTVPFSELMSFGPLATGCAPAGPTGATGVAPTVTQSQCVNGVASTPSYTVPTTTGVIYTPATGGPGVAGTTTTVTAAAAPGFVLSGPSSFVVTFDPAPNCATIDNVGVSKTGPGTAQPGDELVYTVDVTNVAGTPATGFTVTDVLPTGLSYSLASGTDFTCTNAGQTISCLYGASLAVGQKATFTVRAVLDPTYTGKTVANTAIVDPGRPDANSADNSSTATTDITPLPFTGGGGGTAQAPSPSPSPAPPATGGGIALPFTGSDSGRMLQLGVSLLLTGLFIALTARRRRVGTDSD